MSGRATDPKEPECAATADSPPPLIKRSLTFIALAVVLMALAFPMQAHAQDEEQYVDLAVEMEVKDDVAQTNSKTYLRVSNLGNLTAYDVEVEVRQTCPGGGCPPLHLDLLPIGTATVALFTGVPNGQFTWHIPEFPPNTRYVAELGHPSSDSPNRVFEYSATANATGSFEQRDLLHNNSARVWEVYGPSSKAGPARGNYSLDVSVDERRPSTGDTVNFSVLVERASGLALFAEGCVNVWLTSGLTAGTATFEPTTDRSFDTSTSRSCGGTDEATGVFKLPDTHSDRTSTMTLPVTVNSNVTVEEQCLTAEIFATPPPGRGQYPDDPSDNLVKICLGELTSVAVIRTDPVDLLDLYPCVGETNYPCDSTDTVELVVSRETTNIEGVFADVWQPDEVVVHVQDPQGRGEDSAMELVWSTGSVSTTGTAPAGERLGVVANLSLPSPDYTAYTFGISDAGTKPGIFRILNATNTGFTVLDVDTKTSLGPINTTSTAIPLLFEFGELGTYEMEITAGGTDSNDNTKTYTDTETYTFHVGPMAELEVRDGGVNPDLNADQYALTVFAWAHGPDLPVDAEVTIDLSSLPAGVTVTDHIASEGTYSGGTWDLGALRVPDYYRSNGKPGAAMLTLILDGDDVATATATATIANATDYSVCIDGDGNDLDHDNQTACENVADASWHTGPVYDPKDDNNMAALTARAGTGGGGEGAPTLRGADDPGASITVTWDAVESVNGVAVTHYEIERLENPWSPPTRQVMGTEYVDTDVSPGNTYQYRVRAVNGAGVPGPWSATMEGTAASSGGGTQTVTRTVTRTVEVEVHPDGPTRLRATADGPTRIDLSWTGPRELYGHAVTSYELEVSEDRDIWTTLEPYLEGTRYTHTGLLASTTYYYRVYAHNAEGRSLASEVASATTEAPPTLTGYLENPAANSFQSGVGVLSGWVCEADEVILQINGTAHPAVYGTERADTQAACGDTDNGFGLLFNWNELGDGSHEVVALVDGAELGRATVTVTTLGSDFLRGVSGACELTDFPSTGEQIALVWQEAKQNFVITDGSAPPTGSSAVESDITGFLEIPPPNSAQSGIGVLSGWVCEANAITLEVDGQTYAAGYGTARSDTESACGDTDNGFGLLFNWNNLGDGAYDVVARADGVIFDRATVRVTTLGEPFRTGLAGTCEVTDFPSTGQTVTLTWQQAQQNFVMTNVE